MSYLVETFAAGETKRVAVPGRFLLLVSCGSAVNIAFFNRLEKLDESVQGVTAGFSFRIASGFDAVEIYSASAQTMIVLISNGEVGFADAVSIVNDVGIRPQRKAVTQAQATVTNTAANLLDANANRSYLLIQNKDAAGNLYLNLQGTTATAANGLKIGPGQSLELTAVAPTSAISAIGDIASNANIVTVEAS